MRPVVLAVGLVLALAAGRSEAQPRIIDVRPQRKKAAVARIPEVRVAMGDSETARNLAPSLLEQLRSLGYEVAPAVDFEVAEKPKPARALLRFEILRSGGSCFISAKATEPKAETSFWRWETGDDLRPCATQLEEAVVSFARARPPARPKAPEQPPAVEPEAQPAAVEPEAQPAAGPAVVGLVPVAAPGEGEGEPPAVADAGAGSGEPAVVADGAANPAEPAAEPPADSAPTAPGEGEGEGAAADAAGEPAHDGLETPSEKPEGKACGCGTAGSAAPMGALLLAALGIGSRRRSR